MLLISRRWYSENVHTKCGMCSRLIQFLIPRPLFPPDHPSFDQSGARIGPAHYTALWATSHFTLSRRSRRSVARRPSTSKHWEPSKTKRSSLFTPQAMGLGRFSHRRPSECEIGPPRGTSRTTPLAVESGRDSPLHSTSFGHDLGRH